MATIYAVTADLFFAERLQQALTQLAHQPRVFDLSAGERPSGLVEAALVIVDLEGGEAALGLVREAQASGTPVLAFGPHVDLDLRKAALEAGATRVVTKSKLTQAFADLVAELLPH